LTSQLSCATKGNLKRTWRTYTRDVSKYVIVDI
jgi:hypothetical protein